MKLVKCVNCNANVNYEIVEVEYDYVDEEISMKYNGKKAICKKCGKEIIIDEIEDFNQFQFEEQYRKLNEIISKKEINELLTKYQIGKRPLSLLLGFGEVTITRYLSDYIPTKKNSLLLKKILYNPECYYSILITNKKNISNAAYNKSMKAVMQYIDEKSFEDDNITEVTNYIISKIDVTPKGLQKLLYYIQVFSMKFLDYPAFTSSCKKWAHGPVFGKIYFQYKNYGYNVIKIDCKEKFNIEKELLEISDEVIKNFGCYSANVLEYFTHKEKPWVNTTENEIIEKDLMKEFVLEICDDYEIKVISDIGKYSQEMFKNFLNSN